MSLEKIYSNNNNINIYKTSGSRKIIKSNYNYKTLIFVVNSNFM